jgi:hypothetical protein
MSLPADAGIVDAPAGHPSSSPEVFAARSYFPLPLPLLVNGILKWKRQ